MKKYFVILIAISFFGFASGQTKNKTTSAQPAKSTPSAKDSDLEIYNLAVQFGDYDVAKHALYSLMIKHPDSKGWLDSLVVLYYNLNASPQCILAGNAYLEKDTMNSDIMEIVAQSNSSLKRNREAVALYEKLYQRSGKIYFAYQLAVQQYLLKRIGECNQMIDIIINDPQSLKETIGIGTDEGRQNVPLKAAALNLRGIILTEINMKDKSKEALEAALKVYPEFALAKKNLDALNADKDNTDKNPAKDQPVKEK